jgi:hypothetical protein
MQNQTKKINYKGHEILIEKFKDPNSNYYYCEIIIIDGKVTILKGIAELVKKSAKGVTLEINNMIFKTSFVIPNQLWEDALQQ